MSEESLEMQEQFRNEIRYLERLESRLAETEGSDNALRTYYHEIAPSELTRFLIEYLRTGEEEDLGY